MNATEPPPDITKLKVNTLLDWGTGTDPHVERVLWVENNADVAIVIDLFHPAALPKSRHISEITSALISGKARLQNHDLWAHLKRPEENIPQHQRERRDKDWAMIAPLVEERQIESYSSPRRGKFIADFLASYNAARKPGEKPLYKRQLYRILRKFYQRGQVKNALLPNYSGRCGGPSKRRNAGNRKRGRRGKFSQGRGINVTETVLEKIIKGIRFFYDTSQKNPITYAYNRTLETFFYDGFEMKGRVLVPKLLPADQAPTERQFRYWAKQTREIEKSEKARQGEHAWDLRIRPVTGTSKGLAHGPGWCFQIDATIADIYLVSSFDRHQIIGRPVLYSVVDVFSRLIVGFHVTLEHPSYNAACLAIRNAFTDKVAYCISLGLPKICRSQWPSHHLCKNILGDRGEMAGAKVDTLVNSTGITVLNTASYRADWKGIVERSFRTFNDSLIRWIPGSTTNPEERGHRTNPLDAVFTLHEFRQLMVWCILHHNNTRMPDYMLEPDMVSQHVQPIPSEIWTWGIQNRTGDLAQVDDENLRLCLLPTVDAYLSSSGITHKGMHYMCPEIEPLVTATAVEAKGKPIRVSIDPNSPEAVYFQPNATKPAFRVPIRQDDVDLYGGKDLIEIETLHDAQGQDRFDSRTEEHQKTADFHAQADAITEEAVNKKKARPRVRSKAAIKAETKNARLREKQLESGKIDNAHPPTPQETKVREMKDYIAGPDDADLLEGLFAEDATPTCHAVEE